MLQRISFALFKFIIMSTLGLLITVSASASPMLINGAGASFPYPLYSKWFSEYSKVDPTVQINYQSIGSGGGIRQFLAGTTDFGASDAPMKDEELKKASTPVLHIPTTLGAVALTYNIPGVKESIRLTPELITGIFSGQIKKWDDERIQKINPKVKFPKDQWIIVAYRSDGSGTTAVFTDFLAKVDQQWLKKVGKGKSIKWPTGLGGKGNEGVTGLIKQNPGAIGYVELTYAASNDLPVASVRNQAGNYVKPSVESVTAAADGAIGKMPQDFRVSITNASGENAYPISAYTYLLVHKDMDKKMGQKIVKFLGWALDEGQKMAPELKYAPLPKSVVSKVKAKVATIELK